MKKRTNPLLDPKPARQPVSETANTLFPRQTKSQVIEAVAGVCGSKRKVFVLANLTTKEVVPLMKY